MRTRNRDRIGAITFKYRRQYVVPVPRIAENEFCSTQSSSDCYFSSSMNPGQQPLLQFITYVASGPNECHEAYIGIPFCRPTSDSGLPRHATKMRTSSPMYVSSPAFSLGVIYPVTAGLDLCLRLSSACISIASPDFSIRISPSRSSLSTLAREKLACRLKIETASTFEKNYLLW